MSPEKVDTTTTDSHDKENLHQSKLVPETPNTKTASDIVMEEQSRVLTEALDNTTMSTVSTLSRLHEKTFSRAEYSSNYGNLIWIIHTWTVCQAESLHFSNRQVFLLFIPVRTKYKLSC